MEKAKIERRKLKQRFGMYDFDPTDLNASFHKAYGNPVLSPCQLQASPPIYIYTYKLSKAFD